MKGPESIKKPRARGRGVGNWQVAAGWEQMPQGKSRERSEQPRRAMIERLGKGAPAVFSSVMQLS